MLYLYLLYMQKQIQSLWKHESEYYFDDLIRDLISSDLIASVTLVDDSDSPESHIERRRYRAYLNHTIQSSERLRHRLMDELQVAVSPTHKKYAIEIIGVYRDY